VSYLLEALKRLEEKRQGASSSDLLTIQVSAKQKSGQKRLLWPYILSLALIANAGVAAWWIFAKHDTPHQILPTPSVAQKHVGYSDKVNTANTQATSNEKQAASREGSKVVPNKPSEKTPSPATARTPDKTQVPGSANGSSSPPVVKVAQAPVKPRSMTSQEVSPATKGPLLVPVASANGTEAAKEALPDLKVSLHSYSPDPSARLVRINDKTVKEGESLSPDIKVESITPDGVIVIHQGRRHNLSVRPIP
jgi:general secretion pathway protein B